MDRENTDVEERAAMSSKPTLRELAAMTVAGYMVLLPALLCTVAAIFAVLFFFKIYLM